MKNIKPAPTGRSEGDLSVDTYSLMSDPLGFYCLLSKYDSYGPYGPTPMAPRRWAAGSAR